MRFVAGLCALLLSLGSVAATVTASWDRPQTNVDGSPAVIDGYRISYVCQSRQGTVPATPEQTTRQIDVPDGEQCSASMVAYNAGGESQQSNTVQFTTPPLDRPGAVRNLRISWTERPAEPEPTMDLIFSDNFNRANSGNLGANWQNVLGSPAVASNQARKGTLSVFDESMALVSSWSQVEALEIRATTGGAGGGANPALVFAQRLGVDMVVGFILYFGTEGANLYFYDDINETYGVVAAGAGIGTLTGVQVALSIETVGSALEFRAYRRDNNATTLTYTAPFSSLPAHFNAPKPGLGFYDEANNTPWIDNFEVWVPSSGVTRVSSDLEAQWDVRSRAEADLSLLWAMRQSAGAELSLEWALRELVAADSALAWDLLSRTAADLSLPWSVFERAAAEIILQWQQRQGAGSAIDLPWDLRQQAAADLQLEWATLERAGGEVSIPWSLLQRVASELSLEWQQRQAAGADLSALWDVREAVLADLGIAWDIDSATGRVGASLAVRWSIAQRLAASVDALWDVRERAEADADLRWTILQRASRELLSRWDVRERLAAGADLRWDVIARAGADLTLRWHIESEQSFPDLTGTIVISSATSRISIASASPGITITSATPTITIH